MLTIEQDKEQLQTVMKLRWDMSCKLPDYVDRYVKMMKKALPTIEIRPWTLNRCVSFFFNGEYIGVITYDYIEDLMEPAPKKKTPWYIKFWRRNEKLWRHI